MKRIYLLLIALICLRISGWTEASQSDATMIITLEQAIKKSLQHNFELSIGALEIKAKKAQIIQEGLLPNPEVEFEFENLFQAQLSQIARQATYKGIM